MRKGRAMKASNWQFPTSLRMIVEVTLVFVAARNVVVALLTNEGVTKTANKTRNTIRVIIHYRCVYKKLDMHMYVFSFR